MSQVAKKAKFSQSLIPHPNPPTLLHNNFTTEQLRQTISQHEFCVIRNVLNESAVKGHCDGLKKAYASIFDKKTGVSMAYDWDKPDTLIDTPPYKGNGIVAVEGTAGLLELVALRQDKNVAQVFEKYYSTSELATSNDRYSVMLPSNEKSGLAPHIDANPNNGEEAVAEDMLQGFVVLKNSVDNTQGFVIYPGHAKSPSKWANGKTIGDFYLLTDEQKEQLGQGYIISPPAGSMVVWLSTAVHANTNGKGKKTQVGRVVAYVAKYPWNRISEKASKLIERAMLQKITLGHNVLRPSFQKTSGALRFAPKIDWTFGAEHLTNYVAVEDIPAALRCPSLSQL